MPNAVVYLKNEKTLNVRTFIAQKDGTYRFPQLSPNVDYEVYAELDGKKQRHQDREPVRRSRRSPTSILQIDVTK